jgi:ribonuclease R
MIRQKAPRTTTPGRTQTTSEQVFSKAPAKAKLVEDGEKPVRKKKAKSISSPKKPVKQTTPKPESKDKVKKVKKKRANAKAKAE